MKRFSLVCFVLFFIGITVYAQESGWRENGSNVTLRQSGDRVGIGTDSPAEKLHINGSIRGNQKNGALRIQTSRGYLDIGSQSSSWCHMITDRSMFYFNKEIRVSSGKIGTYKFHDLQLRTGGETRITVDKDNGNVGIGGNPSSGEKLTVHGTNTLGAGIANSHFPWTGNGWAYVSGKGIIFREDAAGSYVERMRIADNGNVGIGTTNTSSYKLSVNGKIRAKEVRVETNWSDFVFADDYELMPLSELEKHIEREKSLPGIPTEKEVQKDGIEVGKIQAKLLEKIEELTLYVIELKKNNEELKRKNEKIEVLEERISILEKK